jgi:hypothetical protein
MEHDSALDQPLTPPSDRHPGIELRHLRYLVAVAEAGMFTQAAERMCLAQPTLSQQEQMVGTPLLSRQRNGVHLTAAGVEVIWLAAPLDAGFSVICRRQADAALGWLMSDSATLPGPLDAMELGQFEPELRIPAVSAGDRRVMGLDELVGMDTAAVAWSGDLPRHLQQLLFDTADAGVCLLSRSGGG